MKLIRRQKLWLAIVITANLALWIIPSDVVEQIARDRQTMLGRYSRTHFTWIAGVALASLVSFYIDWSTGETYKRRWFRVLAGMMVLFPSLAVIDFLLRSPEAAHYVRETPAYHRPPNADFEIVHNDAPEAFRTYPNAPRGFGTVKCVLHTDGRGYRNRETPDRCDVLVLGDSFAEGSNISDEHAWPARLAALSGLSVYNLGMSGYDTFEYHCSLKEHGLDLKPRYVLCMLYEGNDFRSAKSDRKRQDPSFSSRLKDYIKQSPILTTVDNLLINTFGPINCDGPVRGAEILDWVPLAVPPGPAARHYAVQPKQLRDLFLSRAEFAADKHWLNPRRHLQEMDGLCREAGARFVVVYAPTAAHVLLPTLAGRLPADKIRAYTALRYKGELPEPDKFLTDLLERVDAREAVVREWCEREGIAFFSTVASLRAAAVSGAQVYYTYDQHWTPPGHAVVAEALCEHIRDTFMPESEQTTGP